MNKIKSITNSQWFERFMVTSWLHRNTFRQNLECIIHGI